MKELVRSYLILSINDHMQYGGKFYRLQDIVEAIAQFDEKDEDLMNMQI